MQRWFGLKEFSGIRQQSEKGPLPNLCGSESTAELVVASEPSTERQERLTVQMGPGGRPAGGTSLPSAKRMVGDFCEET